MRLLTRMLVTTLGALAIVPSCAGGSAAHPPLVAVAAVPVPRLVATGIIVNGVTARPLTGAIIELDGRPRAESGADGRFRIEDVPAGRHLLATRAGKFRSRIQGVSIALPDPQDPEDARHNDFIVLLFAPSAYFDEFPPLGNTPTCLTDKDCPARYLCLMNNFKEIDAPTCAVPKVCTTEVDCKLGQQCEPVTLLSGAELRVCHGQPAPEVTP